MVLVIWFFYSRFYNNCAYFDSYSYIFYFCFAYESLISYSVSKTPSSKHVISDIKLFNLLFLVFLYTNTLREQRLGLFLLELYERKEFK